MSLFLQLAGFDNSLMGTPPVLGGLGGANFLGPFFAMFVAMAVVAIIVLIAIYVYLALAFKKIGTKTGLQNPNVSWINPVISIFIISKMHWWPWPMLFIGMMLSQLLILASPVAGMIIYGLILIVFAVMVIIWHWKTFEAVGRPGWWILIPVILEIVGVLLTATSVFAGVVLGIIGFVLIIIGFIAYLVLVGIAAWGSSGAKAAPVNPKVKKI